jgi:hypothetical protein
VIGAGARRAASIALGTATVLVAMTAQSATATAAQQGLWHFDERSGSTAVDSSGAGNNGTLRGGVGMGLAGHAGTAFSFTRAGSWVEVPTATSLNPGARDFSFSAWINITQAPGKNVTYDIVRKGVTTTSGGEFKLEMVPGGRARCTAKDGTGKRGSILGPSTNLADSRWHEVGCARVGSAWRVVVDGTVRSTTAGLGSISNTKSLSIGSKYGLEDATPGLVDEVVLSIG